MMQPGTYYIGDLQYVLTKEQWSDVCELIDLMGQDEFENSPCEFTLSDKVVVSIAPVSCGDAVSGRRGQARVSLPISSGTIGCVSIDHVKDFDEASLRGWIVDFEYPFIIKYVDGAIRIGDVWISSRIKEEPC